MEKLKTQKVIMMKKVKDEQELLAKFKQERAKELAQLKQSLFKKEKENSELRREAQKKEVFAKRKNEELQAIVQRQKLDQRKKVSAKDQRHMLKQVDLDQIRQWIVDNVLKMVDYQELIVERHNKDQEFSQNETEIDKLQAQYARISVANDKLLQQQEQNVNEQYDTQLQQFKEQMDEVNEKLEFLETRQKFINQQILELIRLQEEIRPDAIDSKVMDNVQSLEGARACISIFFQLLLEAKLMTNEVYRDVELKNVEVDNLEKHLEQLKQLIYVKNQYHESAIQELQQSFSQREKLWFNVVIEKTGIDATGIAEGDLNKLF